MALRLIIQRRLPQLGGGGWFASQCPAGLDRNRWSVCVGIRNTCSRNLYRWHSFGAYGCVFHFLQEYTI